MFVLMFSSSDPNEIDCQRPSVIAHGDTLDDLIQALTDEVASEACIHDGAKLYAWGYSAGDELDLNDIAGLCEAVAEGVTHITLKIPEGPFNAEYCNNWAIDEIDLE